MYQAFTRPRFTLATCVLLLFTHTSILGKKPHPFKVSPPKPPASTKQSAGKIKARSRAINRYEGESKAGSKVDTKQTVRQTQKDFTMPPAEWEKFVKRLKKKAPRLVENLPQERLSVYHQTGLFPYKQKKSGRWKIPDDSVDNVAAGLILEQSLNSADKAAALLNTMPNFDNPKLADITRDLISDHKQGLVIHPPIIDRFREHAEQQARIIKAGGYKKLLPGQGIRSLYYTRGSGPSTRHPNSKVTSITTKTGVYAPAVEMKAASSAPKQPSKPKVGHVGPRVFPELAKTPQTRRKQAWTAPQSKFIKETGDKQFRQQNEDFYRVKRYLKKKNVWKFQTLDDPWSYVMSQYPQAKTSDYASVLEQKTIQHNPKIYWYQSSQAEQGLSNFKLLQHFKYTINKGFWDRFKVTRDTSHWYDIHLVRAEGDDGVFAFLQRHDKNIRQPRKLLGLEFHDSEPPVAYFSRDILDEMKSL